MVPLGASIDVPWIQNGSAYVFRLYAGKERSKVLASVTVTRATTN